MLKTPSSPYLKGSTSVMFKTVFGILIPFFGTLLGAALVFVMKKDISEKAKSGISGFAAGVMLAASVWSLLIPAIDRSSVLGVFAFAPPVIGFFIGVIFLYLLDKLAPTATQGRSLPIAVTLHNLPEGMAVGVVYADLLIGGDGVTYAAALALSLGIAIQNFPEGAIISLPMRADGKSKLRAFTAGTLSGAVEPLGALLLILASGVFVTLLPYVLGFAAGAMIYVVAKELLPEATEIKNSYFGVIMFTVGFAVMMMLDVALS